jgi:hypothetical protein
VKIDSKYRPSLTEKAVLAKKPPVPILYQFAAEAYKYSQIYFEINPQNTNNFLTF